MKSFPMMLSELHRYRSEVTFLVGENGSGKSTNLAILAREAIDNGRPVLAISNTVYDRFPRIRGSYSELAGMSRRNLPGRSLIQAIMASDSDQREKNLHRIGNVLRYLGFGGDIGISIDTSLRNGLSFHRTRLDEIRPLFDGQPDGIIWLRGSESGYARSSLNILHSFQQGGGYPRYKPLPLEFHLRKGGRILKIGQASSGELTLLATYAFIAANIHEGALLLIDEPENSLHPKWQHEYCTRLLDMFYLYSPQIIIATHSPLIVSGAQGHKLPIQILEVDGAMLTPRQVTGSIEATLYESFQTLSPSNHFLSEQVARLLDELSRGELSKFEFERRIQGFEGSSYDQTQRDFLSRVRDLGDRVMVGSGKDEV
ncbi:AAA family ATPase [Burkholderia cenocepacia]|uniref:AAA family ATPase n=1 Tax=Burkholderia cenocepacia TaxID=95486 RepID=UPI002AB65C6F|nr:AAA family ATPase [Burkholderia cenocepacia]